MLHVTCSMKQGLMRLKFLGFGGRKFGDVWCYIEQILKTIKNTLQNFHLPRFLFFTLQNFTKQNLGGQAKMEQPIINPTGESQFSQPMPGNNLPQPSQQGPKLTPKIIIAGVVVVLAVGGFLFFRNSKQASNNNQLTNNVNGTFVLPIGNYKDYAFSDNTESFNPDNPAVKAKAEEGFSFPVTVLEKGDGFAVVGAGSIEGGLIIPLGWEGFDNGRKVVFKTPDLEIVISLNYVDIGEEDFVKFKEEYLQEIRQENQEVSVATVEYSELPGGGFLTKSIDINLKDFEGGKFSSFTVYIPNSSKPEFPLKVVLSAPSKEKLEKYSGLLGLILRDLETEATGGIRINGISANINADRIVSYLQEKYPEAKKGKPEELKVVVRRVMTKAEGYGFTTAEEFEVYVNSSWLLGENFDTKFPAATQTLGDKNLSSSEKSAWLGDWTTEIFKTLEKK